MDMYIFGFVIGMIAILGIAIFALKEFRGDRGRMHRPDDEVNIGREEDTDNPFIPNFLENKPVRLVGAFLGIVFLIWIITSVIVLVPAGHRGVLLTLGKVEPVNLQEGLHLVLPWQNVEMMSVMIQKAEVTESTASNDLQEITTKLAVHYRISEASVWNVYQSLRTDYLHLLIEPVIMEELKATTADWTAEHLITERPLVVIQLTDTLGTRLRPYGIDVLTVNIIDFQFSQEFWDAIERKVVATQDALTEKNKVEISRFQQQQYIINAEGQYNVTVINAEASAQQKILAAQAEGQKILIEAEAQAEAIRIINEQVTPEYVSYLRWLNWDGKLPSVILGENDLLLTLPAEIN